MKTHNQLTMRLHLFIAAACMVVSGTALAQDTAEKSQVRLKVIKQVDGKTTIVDTTFAKGSAEFDAYSKRMADFSPMREQMPIRVCKKVKEVTLQTDGAAGPNLERRIVISDSIRLLNIKDLPIPVSSPEEIRELLKLDPELRNLRIDINEKMNLPNMDLAQLPPPVEIEKLLKEKGIEKGMFIMNCDISAAAGKPFTFSCDSTLFKFNAEHMQLFKQAEGEENALVLVRVTKLNKDEATLPEKENELVMAEKKPLKVDDFAIYPNPTAGRFNLSFELEDKGTTAIRIFDTAGRQVYSEELKRFSGNYSKEIDLSGNPQGVYFVRVDQGRKGFSQKIVLQ